MPLPPPLDSEIDDQGEYVRIPDLLKSFKGKPSVHLSSRTSFFSPASDETPFYLSDTFVLYGKKRRYEDDDSKKRVRKLVSY